MSGDHARDGFEATLPFAGASLTGQPSPGLAAEVARIDTAPSLVPGYPTGPLAQVHDAPAAPEPVPAPLPRCRCGYCDGHCKMPPLPGGDPRVLLYCGPGIVRRNWQARVREGQWDDIPAGIDAARVRVHLPARKRAGEIRMDVSSGWDHLAVVFGAHPGWLADPDLARGLHAAEAALEAGLAAMRRNAAEREAERRAA
jgi:hypothetical protein